jgi:GNAT superfamily N-acetyltransferase
LRVIKGSESHHEECVAIARSLDRHFDANARVKIPQDLKVHDLYVAIEGDEVLGFLTLLRKSDHVAEITWMGVRREWWREGIGTALVASAEEDLVAAGHSILEVKTLDDRVDYEPYEWTRAFYERKGFHYLETVLEWDPQNPCAIYIKPLSR